MHRDPDMERRLARKRGAELIVCEGLRDKAKALDPRAISLLANLLSASCFDRFLERLGIMPCGIDANGGYIY